MFSLDHVIQLNSLCYFQAGQATKLGAEIPPGAETLELLTAGNVKFDVAGEEQLFGEGALFWHIAGEGTIRKNVLSNPYECFVISFKVKSPPALRQVPRVSVLKTKGIAEKIQNEFNQAFHNPLINQSNFCQYAYTRMLWEAYNSSFQQPEDQIPRLLQKAISYIQKNYNKDLYIEDIAKKSSMSPSYLYMLFQKHLKQSPHQYLLETRLKQAQYLLLNSDHQVKEISDLCGFMNAESFCRNFKKRNKITPGKYREKHYSYFGRPPSTPLDL